MNATLFYVAVSCAVASLAGVYFVRGWVQKRGMLDVPNERSSHTQPTPRGGGIVIAAVPLAALIGFAIFEKSSFPYGFVVGAILIVAVSWFDDVYDLSPKLRILVHFFAAGSLLADRGAYPIFAAPAGMELPLVLEYAISLIFIVWLINAYNFMDGIDGIAGIQAVVAGVGWAAIGWYAGVNVIAVLGTAAAAASLGFLVFNWAPAKIFMGDAGSAYLGYVFAGIGLLAPTDSGVRVLGLPLACLLLWPFLFDSVYTIAKRILRREKIWHAHRSHIYQLLVQRGYSHSTVSLFYGMLAAGAAVVAVTSGIAGNTLVSAWIAAGVCAAILLVSEFATAGREARSQ